MEFNFITAAGDPEVRIILTYKVKNFRLTIYKISEFFSRWSHATGCIRFANDIAYTTGTELSEHNKRDIAASAMILVARMHDLIPKIGVKVMSLVGMIKLVILLFIVVTGWVVLGGGIKRILDPGAGFHIAITGLINNAIPYAMVL
ncbi:uncharacterized protein Z518_01354 [Rhinocladiella mackenziei CBS 650.93]|uniref:Uncharacterized protein n=1 Tax=Rhinocladiella mackenziei CBS 650.93 TaxID=1442369 RepID=A0A0D2G5S3_9EURO|nr:uncharacterized protein Z518_01354 [Rhinocladiella mackenziei CBS 650.93]KIX10272.1 hypothetical protein Z518_01354 [Rhinocladiella mackenziei CBS 650.93]